MTELFIDGQPVTLPESLDLKVKQQNPLITKNGTFTMELVLSLEENNNAKLYQHIDRLQSAAAINNRKALLIADGKVVINGTEAIISNTDKEVKIQLLSGNSELNYFIGSDIYVSDLDLGRENITDENFEATWGKVFPDVNFCPSKVKVDKAFYNYRNSTGDSVTYTSKRMQPYLLALLTKIIKSLGYTISVNELEADPAACSIFFINNIDTGDYNKMLPGWKALDFIEECETFFNIVFDINEHDKTVRILKRSADSRFGIHEINNVLDSFERTFTEDDPEINYKNVCYDFNSVNWYKYEELSEDVLNMADIRIFSTFEDLKVFLDVYSNTNGWVPNYIKDPYYKTMILFYCEDVDTYFMVEEYYYHVGEGTNETATAVWYYLRPINRFKKFTTTEDDDFVKLKFIPAQIAHESVGSIFIFWTSTVPFQSEQDESDEEDPEATNIRKYIENGVKDFNSKQKRVCLAYYKRPEGLELLTGVSGRVDWIGDGPTSNKTTVKDNYTFRLDGPNGLHARYYSVNERYDTTKEYTIRFLANTMLDVRKEFLFNNKLFICKELEYRLNKGGIHPEVTGIFYEVK